jgi:23S rRNA 5-hydroxycytidine C2501 synthase
MQLKLELLAPAKNKDIGISAINCGADAVYIAGPAFGAREAASNSILEVGELAGYAHRFGARVYMTLNTILYDSELSLAEQYIHQAYLSGCDAVIIQDLGILKMSLPPIDLYASTQCDIRTPEQAQWLESLGFKRLILARELSLKQIRDIRSATSCELESFIHGALCVSYSGQCYLSQYLSGRSANRGSCIQACRSNYDLTDSSDHILVKNKPLLSLKDLSLSDRIQDLIEAGITSFKIEGRLKNASYVKNVVRFYRNAIDHCPDGRNKTSLGELHGGFSPNLQYTFSRGSTQFFIDGVRGQWNSADAAKAVGQRMGTISEITKKERSECVWRLAADPLKDKDEFSKLSNGDGLFLVSPSGATGGVRVDIAEGAYITTKNNAIITKGGVVYRNFNQKFEKELENNMPKRLIDVETTIQGAPHEIIFTATAEGGYEARVSMAPKETKVFEEAKNRELSLENIKRQFEKSSDIYLFHFKSYGALPADEGIEGYVPFLPLSTLNTVRRELSERLTLKIIEKYRDRNLSQYVLPDLSKIIPPARKERLNCSNRLSRDLYETVGIHPAPAFELQTDHIEPEYRELMRTKYCIKHELGLCGKKTEQLYLINNGKRIGLHFDCKQCEMTLFLVSSQDEI